MVAFELQSAVVSNSTDVIIYKADSSRGYQPLASGFPGHHMQFVRWPCFDALSHNTSLRSRRFVYMYVHPVRRLHLQNLQSSCSAQSLSALRNVTVSVWNFLSNS